MLGAGRGHRRNAAAGVAGGLQTEFARGGAVEEPGLEHAVLDQLDPVRGDAFGVKRSRALAAPPQRVVDDVDAAGENPLPELFAQEARLARHRSAVGGAGDMIDQRTGNARIEHHRHAARRHLARIEPLDCALAGDAADFCGLSRSAACSVEEKS